MLGPVFTGALLVWARDMYEEATTILAAGDREAANDAVTRLFTRQQLPTRGRPSQQEHRLRLKRP